MSIDQIGNNNGGRRPGAGRPKGATASRTLRYLGSLHRRYPILPLERMMAVINDQNASDERRDAAARNAAPYYHPKLAPLIIDKKGEQRYSVDVDKLGDDELIQFERLLLKCQVPVNDDEEDGDEESPYS